MTKKTQSCIALGGNLGDSAETFGEAVGALKAVGIDVLRLSSIHESTAMGRNAGDKFCNAAALIESNRSGRQLLSNLQQIEDSLGRVRTVKWGPRTLDLDLIFHGDQIVETTELTVPHPLMWCRRFVLEPLAEVAADWIHPHFQITVSELLQRINASRLMLRTVGLSPEEVSQLKADLAPEFAPDSFELRLDETADDFAILDFSSTVVEKRLPVLTVGAESSEGRAEAVRDLLTAAIPAMLKA